MKNPLISVIVPIFNASGYLERCIDSIVTQEYANLEIILVDDGSTDESLSICNSYRERDARIIVITQKNMGQFAARKAGILLASGELVGFVDSDDWIERNMYQYMVNLYNEYSCDLVSTGQLLEYENGYVKEAVDHYCEGLYLNLQEDIFPTMVYDEAAKEHGLTASLWNKLFKREILSDVVGGKDSMLFFGEDLCIVLDYCLRVESVYISHWKGYHYTLRDNSVSHAKNEKLLINLYWLYSELESIARDSADYFGMMRQIRQYMLMLNGIYLHMMFDIDSLALREWEFDYPGEVLESRLVIYGAGSCGQALYRNLCERNIGEHVVAWIDAKGKAREKECLHAINLPDELRKICFDFLIIAVQSKNTAEQIRYELVDRYQVENEKIVWRESVYK